MAKVKHNATLENKANIVEFWNLNELGEAVAFDENVNLYIAKLDGTNIFTSNGIASDTPNHIRINVNLTGVVDVEPDYDDPVYNHMYSLRSPTQVYVYGKLNIVSIA